VGCPIRRSRDQRSLASPPGFSQRATSFIASQCQGIHQMPFLALERHTQRQEPFQGPGARNQGSGITPRLAPCRSATNFSQKTLHAGCTRTAHPDKPSGRARFPATVTQLASLRCYINNPPGCPHRVLPRGAPTGCSHGVLRGNLFNCCRVLRRCSRHRALGRTAFRLSPTNPAEPDWWR
jgi:hypothetical protein